MKQNNLLILAALGAAAYFLTRKPKRRGSVIVDEPITLTKEQFEGSASTVPTDVTINADQQGLNLPAAIEVAKKVADKLKDVKIDIFKGGQKRTLRAGRKKVKLTAENKRFFANLGKKTKRKFSVKQQKQIKSAVANITSGGIRFK